MNYLHEEANIDVKHSRRTEYDINMIILSRTNT